MSAILPARSIDSTSEESRYFLPYQLAWIRDDSPMRLAEKSVRIGWTYADAFKNVRKRLRFNNRDYLFATRDYQSALDYIRQAHKFVEYFNFTKAIVAHGEDYMKVNRLDDHGKPSGFQDEIKI